MTEQNDEKARIIPVIAEDQSEEDARQDDIAIAAIRLWKATLERLQAEMTPAIFATWFQGTSGVSLQDAVLTVCVPTQFAKTNLEGRFNERIEAIASEIAGTLIDIRFEVPGQQEKLRVGTMLKDVLELPRLPQNFQEDDGFQGQFVTLHEGHSMHGECHYYTYARFSETRGIDIVRHVTNLNKGPIIDPATTLTEHITLDNQELALLFNAYQEWLKIEQDYPEAKDEQG